MAAHLIKKHNALRAVLRHVNHDAPLIDGEQLPSWVPDFRSRSVPKEVSISHDGLEDLNVDSSISLKESISSCGTNELCLRGHRLTMPGLQRDSPTEYSKTETGHDSFEIRAKFPVVFDHEEHTIFWIPDGPPLQLKRHPTREDAYTFLGECVIKRIGNFNDFVLHYRRLSQVMCGLEIRNLKSLWKLCMNLDCISRHDWDRFGFGSLKLPDTSMGWEKAEHLLNTYDFVTLLERNRTPLEPDAQQLLQCLRFFQSDDTWEMLESLAIKFKYRGRYEIKDINELCLAWLQYYQTAEYLIEQASKITHESSTSRRRLRSKFLSHLKAWEDVTRRLSDVLMWTESSTWPFEDPPRFHKWGRDESGKDTLRKKWFAKMIGPSQKPGRDEGKKAEYSFYGEVAGPNSVIRNNFKCVRFRFDLPVNVVGLWEKRVDYVLEPWNENWAGKIRSIPYLLAINDRTLSIKFLGSMVKFFKQGAKGSEQEHCGRKNLEVWPAEIITLL